MGLASLFKGKIKQKECCEINVVDHCNLTCRDCDHASPVVAKRFVDPLKLHQDLSLLRHHYEARTIKLIGGEPLLHPDIEGVIDAVKRSGLGQSVLMVTNGVLLERCRDQFWRSIDELWVSVYPDSGLDSEYRKWIDEKARQFNIKLIVSKYDSFRVQFSRQRNQDEQLVSRIFLALKH